MSYFSRFPNLLYVDEDERLEIVTDVLRRVAFRTEYKDLTQLFSLQTVEDGERPEQFAYSFYGDAQLHWVILLINDIIDPYRDWPLSQEQVLAMTKKKYGEDKIYAAHHYEVGGIVVNDPVQIEYVFSRNNNGVSTPSGTFIYNDTDPTKVTEILFSGLDKFGTNRIPYFQQINTIDSSTKGLLIVSTPTKPAINVYGVIDDVLVTLEGQVQDVRLFVEHINGIDLPTTQVAPGVEVNNCSINFTSSKLNGRLAGRFASVPLEVINNLEYETRINEAKRQMRVLLPDLLEEFVRQFEEVINK